MPFLLSTSSVISQPNCTQGSAWAGFLYDIYKGDAKYHCTVWKVHKQQLRKNQRPQSADQQQPQERRAIAGGNCGDTQWPFEWPAITHMTDIFYVYHANINILNPIKLSLFPHGSPIVLFNVYPLLFFLQHSLSHLWMVAAPIPRPGPLLLTTPSVPFPSQPSQSIIYLAICSHLPPPLRSGCVLP